MPGGVFCILWKGVCALLGEMLPHCSAWLGWGVHQELFVVCNDLRTFPSCWGAGSGCFPGNPAPEVLNNSQKCSPGLFAATCLLWLFLNIPAFIKSSLHHPPLGNSCSSIISQGQEQGLWGGHRGSPRMGEALPPQPQKPQRGSRRAPGPAPAP